MIASVAAMTMADASGSGWRDKPGQDTCELSLQRIVDGC